MKQIRFELMLSATVAYEQIIESDWIDLPINPAGEQEAIQELKDGIESMFRSEHGFVSFPVDGVLSFYAGKHIAAVRLHTQDVPSTNAR